MTRTQIGIAIGLQALRVVGRRMHSGRICAQPCDHCWWALRLEVNWQIMDLRDRGVIS